MCIIYDIKRQTIGKLLNKIQVDEKKIIKIGKLVKKIEKMDKDNYKYGSSWLDNLFMKRSIKKLNKILEEYKIIIIFD
mgnify:CR=1 FL=1|jgi:hypothetical protein